MSCRWRSRGICGRRGVASVLGASFWRCLLLEFDRFKDEVVGFLSGFRLTVGWLVVVVAQECCVVVGTNNRGRESASGVMIN